MPLGCVQLKHDLRCDACRRVGTPPFDICHASPQVYEAVPDWCNSCCDITYLDFNHFQTDSGCVPSSARTTSTEPVPLINWKMHNKKVEHISHSSRCEKMLTQTLDPEREECSAAGDSPAGRSQTQPAQPDSRAPTKHQKTHPGDPPQSAARNAAGRLGSNKALHATR
jgi:hypothetical protein